MSRTGLVIALAVAGIVGAVFAFHPELDLAISRLFYDPDKPDFPLRFVPLLYRLREAAQWIVAALVAPAAVALAAKLVLPRRRMLMSPRAIVFLLGTLILGPGLLVNVVLKDHWPRSRPVDVPQFGGDERFTPWWDPRGGCPKNCSAVAGEASGAFWTLAPASLTPPQWRPLAYAGALAFGTAVGALRIAFGGHFFTDVAFAGVLMFLLVWTMHGLLYRWRIRPSDEAIERVLGLVALPSWLSPAPLIDRWRARRRGENH
jgi:membrane-associated PAP2 superfamily phosphatase